MSLRRYQHQSVILRFFEKVRITDPDDCWIWIGAHHELGYGRFWDPVLRKVVPAHVWSYRHFNGPIPDGYEVDHLCRVPPCVNPWPRHTKAVPPRVNWERRVIEKCRNGHPLSESYVQRNGRLCCRVCRRARREVYRSRPEVQERERTDARERARRKARERRRNATIRATADSNV